MRIDNIDHVTVVYQDGHNEVYYKGHVKGQQVDTELTGGNIKTSYISLILTPRKEEDAIQGT